MLLCRGSFKQTMSGEAWRQRNDKTWNWLHKPIDWVFLTFFRQRNHCEQAAEAEAKHGSIWGSWRCSWARIRRPAPCLHRGLT
jgi:hypothetical protein